MGVMALRGYALAERYRRVVELAAMTMLLFAEDAPDGVSVKRAEHKKSGVRAAPPLREGVPIARGQRWAAGAIEMWRRPWRRCE